MAHKCFAKTASGSIFSNAKMLINKIKGEGAGPQGPPIDPLLTEELNREFFLADLIRYQGGVIIIFFSIVLTFLRICYSTLLFTALMLNLILNGGRGKKRLSKKALAIK